MKPGNAGGGKGPQFKANAGTRRLGCRWRYTRKRRQNRLSKQCRQSRDHQSRLPGIAHSLRVSSKGGRRDALAINPQTAAPLRLYLEAWEHGADIDGPLFRPLHHNGKRQDQRRGMDPDAIGRVVRKYATELGLDRGYPAHSMRATFRRRSSPRRLRTAPSSRTFRHRDPGTTKLYDRRGYNPEKAASFFATY